jgi:hypothetical protein
MNTIISAFFSDINNNKSINKYYELGKLLLLSDTPKIIFVDIVMYNMIEEYENENTKIIIVDKSFIYMYDYIDKLSNFNLNTNNINKDTIEYMFIMCSKTEWLRRAILYNPFKTDHFIWLDFGLRHVFKCSDDEFIMKINNMKYKVYDDIRIGHIWDLNINYSFNIYKDITWYFAGGVVGGGKDELLKLADRVKHQCIDIMTNQHTIMWEVNVWYMVYQYNMIKSNMIKYNPYKCDHNDSIIDNY